MRIVALASACAVILLASAAVIPRDGLSTLRGNSRASPWPN
jgi:hypothetical protein